MTQALPETSPIGRRGQFELLRELVSAAAGGRGAVAYVEGEPGIGKTSLVRAVAAEATMSGCQVYWATCDELSQAFPLVPLLEALAAGLHSAGEAPGLDGINVAVEHILSAVDEACAAAPTMLVVDDIQWGDPATVQTVGRLARSVHQIPLLLVCVARPVPRRDDVSALRRAVPAGSVVQLRGLPDDAVTDLLASAVGGQPGERLLRLAAGAGGNPLYLTELVGALDRAGALVRGDGAVEATGAATPASLTAAICDRLEFLPPPARDVVRLAALLGVDFSVAELAVVSGRQANDLLPILDEAMLAGVLVDSDGCLAFRHPLIRTALYNDRPASVRVLWQRDAARALASNGASADRVARQLLASLDHRDGLPVDEWAVEWLVGSGRWLVSHAPDAAIPLMRWAVDGLAPGEPAHDLLICRLADALYRMGHTTEAAEVAAVALAYVSEPVMFVDLHWTLSLCRMREGRSGEYLASLRAALDAPGLGPSDRARLLVLIARAQRSLGDLEAAAEAAAEALTLADQDDRCVVAWALGVQLQVHGHRGETDEALILADRALSVAAGDPGLVDLRLLLQTTQASILGTRDQYERAIDAAEAARQLADDAGNMIRLAQARCVLGELFFEVGRWDDALIEINDDPVASKNLVVGSTDHGCAATILLHRNDPAATFHLTKGVAYAARLGDRVIGSIALAESLSHEQAGRPREALDVLSRNLTDPDEMDESPDLLADAVRLAMSLGDLETAHSLVSRAETMVETSGVVGHRAIARHVRGLSDRDPVALREAAGLYERAGRVLPMAQATEAAGLAYADMGATSDARKQFTEAFTLYSSLGAVWDLARMQATFRSYGIRRGPRASHRKVRHGWDGLTATEAKVAALVAEGMSNPQIAADLFLSRRTVQTHVSHILAKLNLSSRIDIAREAAQRAGA